MGSVYLSKERENTYQLLHVVSESSTWKAGNVKFEKTSSLV